MLKSILVIVFFVVASIGTGRPNNEYRPSPTPQDPTSHLAAKVGYPGFIEGIVIGGPELSAKPIENREQPIILRIVDMYSHGDGYRYDLEYIGLEPGTFDLADYLQRPGGKPVQDLPEIKVTIETLLPAGQVEPNQIASGPTRFNSYYLALLLIGGVIWLLGLFAIFFVGRYRTGRPSAEVKAVTVADRLKPLVEQAVSGKMSVGQQAELERVLVAFWRKKLRLGHLPADRLRVELRQHPQAGELLSQIDNWLHRPDPDRNVSVAELLTPYQSLNYDEI